MDYMYDGIYILDENLESAEKDKCSEYLSIIKGYVCIRAVQ